MFGASAKSRSLRKLSHPSLCTRRQASENRDFCLKTAITKTSPILYFAPMRTHNTPHCQKNEQNYVATLCIHPDGLCQPQTVVGARGAPDIVTEPQVTIQEVYRFGHSDFVSRNWFKYL